MSGLRHRQRPLRTKGAMAAGARYAFWMESSAWWARRRRWVAREAQRSGAIRCAVCDRPWDPDRGDLHHLSYARMGKEAHEDLIAMCRPCHEALHRVIDASPAWQSLIASGNRVTVTRSIIERMKKTINTNQESQE